MLKTGFLLFAACLLVSCANLQQDRQQHADAIAARAHLEKSSIAAGKFVLTAYSRISNPVQPVNVYVEGDGLAWLTRWQPSADPTPKFALGLSLAAVDTGPNVVYLARPCQFNDFAKIPCGSTYWTDKRFSSEVIAAMQQGLNTFAVSGTKFNLIGYSGGAAVAALLAAERSDVLSLRTVAGNLDHAYVNAYHKVAAMPESLNPIDVAASLASLPQLHFVGSDDEVVPKAVALRFIARQHGNCAQLLEVNAQHQKHWLALWPQLLSQPLPQAC